MLTGLQTTVSISAYCIHNWDRYFKDPQTFRPERWLEPDAGELDRYMVSFSRGSRSCLGINLATAELYLAFAYLFRVFDFTPYNTTSADIEEWKVRLDECICSTNRLIDSRTVLFHASRNTWRSNWKYSTSDN